jgi:hypothetical protein
MSTNPDDPTPPPTHPTPDPEPTAEPDPEPEPDAEPEPELAPAAEAEAEAEPEEVAAGQRGLGAGVWVILALVLVGVAAGVLTLTGGRASERIAARCEGELLPAFTDVWLDGEGDLDREAIEAVADDWGLEAEFEEQTIAGSETLTIVRLSVADDVILVADHSSFAVTGTERPRCDG